MAVAATRNPEIDFIFNSDTMTTYITNRSKSDFAKDFMLFLLIIACSTTAVCAITDLVLGVHPLLRCGYIGFCIGLLIAVVTIVPNRPSTNAARRRERIMNLKYGA